MSVPLQWLAVHAQKDVLIHVVKVRVLPFESLDLNLNWMLLNLECCLAPVYSLSTQNTTEMSTEVMTSFLFCLCHLAFFRCYYYRYCNFLHPLYQGFRGIWKQKIRH